MSNTTAAEAAVLRVVSRLQSDPSFLADGLVELSDLLATSEGSRAFIRGPPGAPEQGGLCWLCLFLTRLNDEIGGGLVDTSAVALDAAVVIEFLANASEGSAISALELASAPWVNGQACGLPRPLVALLKHIVGGRVQFGPMPMQVSVLHTNLLRLLKALAKDQRVGKRLVVEAGALPPLFATVNALCEHPPANVAAGGWSQQSEAGLEEGIRVVTGGFSAELLLELSQQESTIKEAYLAAGIAGTTLRVTRLATDYLEECGGVLLTPQTDMVVEAGCRVLQAATNILMECEPAADAFRREGGLARAVVDAMRLPGALGRDPDCEPGMLALSAGMAAVQMCTDPPMAQALEAAGAVEAALAFLSAPAFYGRVTPGTVATRLAQTPQCDGGRLVLTCLSLLDILICNTEPFQKLQGDAAVRAARAAAGDADILRALGRAQKQARVVDHLERLGKALQVQLMPGDEATSGAQGPGGIPAHLQGSIAVKTLVTDAHAAIYFNPKGLYESTVKSKEQLKAELHSSAAEGRLDAARAASKELIIITMVEQAQTQGRIEWTHVTETPPGLPADKRPLAVYRGLIAEGADVLVTTREENTPGHIGFSASATSQEHGVQMQMLPGELSEALLVAAEHALLAADLKDEGAALFRAKQWRAAADKYRDAFDCACNSPGPGDAQPAALPGFFMGRLAATCLSNRAQCCLNLGEASQALCDAEAALSRFAQTEGCIPQRVLEKLIFRAALAEDVLGRRPAAVERLRSAGDDGLLTAEGREKLEQWAP